MSIKNTKILILLVLIIIIAYIFISKPYIRDKSIDYNGNDIVFRTNMITGNTFIFDSESYSWLQKEDYIKVIESRIIHKYELLKISNYQSLVDILDGKTNSYSMIPNDRLEFIRQRIFEINHFPSLIEKDLFSDRKKLIEAFNELLLEYQKYEIDNLKGLN